jgi:hypothetical protein
LVLSFEQQFISNRIEATVRGSAEFFMIKIIIGEVPVLPLLIIVFKVNKLSGIN